MNQMLDLWNRKDRRPDETISIFSSVLEELGIRTAFLDKKNHMDLWHSCRLILEDLPSLGTNGKGISDEFSMASALGEFFERLQSGTLLNEYFPGKNDDTSKSFASLEEAAAQTKEYLGAVFRGESVDDIKKMLEKNEKYRSFQEYYSAFEDKTVLLPDKLIYFLCGTNGISAGNTKEEAFVQGLSEIFERYVMKYIYVTATTASDFPVLSHTCYEHTRSSTLLQKIEEGGYHYFVKDCTIGGHYPVLGLLIFDKTYTRYCFNLSCDLDFDLCLQRCITEVFQGHDFDITFRMQMQDVFPNESGNWWDPQIDPRIGLVRSLYDGTGRLPGFMLEQSIQTVELPRVFMKKKASNSECASILSDILRKKELKLYIRDCSCLGVPTLRIYVPGITEIFDYGGAIAIINSLGIVRSLMKQEQVVSSEYRSLFHHLKKILDYPSYSYNLTIAKLSGILFEDSLIHSSLHDVNFFFASLCFFLKEYELANRYFKSHYDAYKAVRKKTISTYVDCILSGFQNGISIDRIKTLFLHVREYDEVCEFIDKLQRIKECGPQRIHCNSCQNCLIRTGCYFDSWHAIYTRIRQRQRDFDDLPHDLAFLRCINP